ncbi:pilus assembly protein N-terminal domain-containing protein [Bradyrhizobium elkanii]|uniref:pilus assembly protein N-terminal domain-containing protein n=1 Tax=Bradyrhizobium elkanii TaxID=29448 RepID=UPI002166E78B|nr:pilus assembly protein N-terminal domain-containing protein [Bradyrhizobium elkanii]MCS3690961.1 opacity protein-like surface antigen [Bradyrhizobium elkanii]
MKQFALGAAVALLCVSPALAQDQNQNQSSGPPPRERPGPTSSGDVISQSTSPVPEDGNIILKFGDTAQIYFSRPIKSVRVEDGLLVRADPKSDHIIAFTGLSPGRSSVTIESTNGSTATYSLVTVVREPHVVKIYRPASINQVTGERRSDSSSAIGGYVTMSCNEIGCTELEPELQARLPR